ncbi:PQQ-dependent sugar dehydrogenase, partial [Devosia albogilva]
DLVGQGGLLDVALAPDFESTGRIYVSYAEPREDGNGTAVAAATLVLDENGGGSLEDVEVIFRQEPTYDGELHFGSRIVPTEDGNLYITVGERSDEPIRDQAQELASGLGKVFRIDPEGEALPDNPFIDNDDALPEIWSLVTATSSRRRSMARGGCGRWSTVPGWGRAQPAATGLNYGWPDVAYGVNYDGSTIGEGITANAETEQPLYYWDPVIAPSGMAYYDADLIPEWQGAFIVGGLVSQGLVVLHMDGDRVAFEERVPLEARVRDVRVGPDGAVYAVTENPRAGSSTIVRVAPEQ